MQLALPHRFDAADVERADHHQRHLAKRRFKEADGALVAAENAGDAIEQRQRHAVFVAGTKTHGEQAAVAGHMDAVVVIRGEVERRRAATGESIRPFAAAEQRLDAVRQAFRLQGHAVLHRAIMRAAAIDRTDDGGVVRIYRARACCQRAGEKVVQRRVGVGIFFRGKVGIGAGDFRVGTDDGIFQKARFHPRQAVHHGAG